MGVGSKNLSAVSLYARSELANILFAKYTLVKRALEPCGDRIRAVATHPGAVHTDRQDQFKEAYGSLIGSLVKAITVPFIRDAEQGSVSTLWTATADDGRQKWMAGMLLHGPRLGGEGDSTCLRRAARKELA